MTSINSRSLEGLSSDADLILIAVSDKALPTVIKRLKSFLTPGFKGIVAHTAGSVSIDVIKDHFIRAGVFYPLQTFTKELPLTGFQQIPIFIEGSDEATKAVLNDFASSLSSRVFSLSSEKRAKLHLAAVFVCNFVNGLYCVANDILAEEQLPFDIFDALIAQTSFKALNFSPDKSQTGPSVRGDSNVIKRHLNLLRETPEIQLLYSVISDYIYKRFQNEQD